MRSRQCEFIQSTTKGSDSRRTSNLYCFHGTDEEFNLDECINASREWANPRGANGVEIIEKYKVGRFEDVIYYAVITRPTYKDN